MAFFLADCVEETITVTGTGSITCSGVSPTGKRSFSAAASDLGAGSGWWTTYKIEDPTSGDWEIQGTSSSTWTTGGTAGTLARGSPLDGSSGPGTKVSFPGNACNVYMDIPAAWVGAQGASPISANGNTTGTSYALTTASFTAPANGIAVAISNCSASEGFSGWSMSASLSGGNDVGFQNSAGGSSNLLSDMFYLPMAKGQSSTFSSSATLSSAGVIYISTLVFFLPGAGPLGLAAGAAYQNTVSAPTKPNSTSAYKMQGLAGSITPARSGNVLVVISGNTVVSATTGGLGVNYQLSYGTGTAPGSNATLAGTQVGAVQTYKNPTTVVVADVSAPFSIQAVITGLTVGASYWLDLAAESITTASDAGFTNVSISAIEL